MLNRELFDAGSSDSDAEAEEAAAAQTNGGVVPEDIEPEEEEEEEEEEQEEQEEQTADVSASASAPPPPRGSVSVGAVPAVTAANLFESLGRPESHTPASHGGARTIELLDPELADGDPHDGGGGSSAFQSALLDSLEQAQETPMPPPTEGEAEEEAEGAESFGWAQPPAVQGGALAGAGAGDTGVCAAAPRRAQVERRVEKMESTVASPVTASNLFSTLSVPPPAQVVATEPAVEAEQPTNTADGLANPAPVVRQRHPSVADVHLQEPSSFVEVCVVVWCEQGALTCPVSDELVTVAAARARWAGADGGGGGEREEPGHRVQSLLFAQHAAAPQWHVAGRRLHLVRARAPSTLTSPPTLTTSN
jgi:hypothetical protein